MSRPQKINPLTTKISKVIEREEDKIRSNHRIGSLKVRTTGKIAQLIWKRVDFIEFDKQWWSPMNLNSIESKVASTRSEFDRKKNPTTLQCFASNIQRKINLLRGKGIFILCL